MFPCKCYLKKVFQVLNFSEMGTQIRIALRAKYEVLPMVLECSQGFR